MTHCTVLKPIKPSHKYIYFIITLTDEMTDDVTQTVNQLKKHQTHLCIHSLPR